jgi:hypothetical protein
MKAWIPKPFFLHLPYKPINKIVMVLYKFNKTSLQFEPVKLIKYKILMGMGVVSTFIIITSFIPVKNTSDISTYTEYEKILILEQLNEFSENKLISNIDKLNFKFPHIVYAQSLIETGNFTSKIFKENNNLFGMREAKVRLNLAIGTQHSHAYYDSWESSLLDYALYASSYLKDINTEEKYFDYLGKNYAEDPNYVSKLRKIIEERDLKNKFN